MARAVVVFFVVVVLGLVALVGPKLVKIDSVRPSGLRAPAGWISTRKAGVRFNYLATRAVCSAATLAPNPPSACWPRLAPATGSCVPGARARLGRPPETGRGPIRSGWRART